MQDNFNTIISNALIVNKDILSDNIKSIIMQVRKAFEINKEAILQANKIDQKNNNGFIIDFDVINNILSNLEKEKILYGNVTLSQKDNEKKIMYGTQIMDYGNVIVITDGNPYITIEMAIRNIMAGNTTIFSNSGFMYGTNQLIIQIIQSILSQFNISKYLVQIYVSENFDEVLSNFVNIDLIVCIGERNLQNLILNKTKNKTIISGYENFDLYVEDSSHIEFINKILDTGLNIQLYIKSSIKLDYSQAITVNDVNEAIAQINYNGSKYSSAIFTSSAENASKFIKEVKSKIVTINTSPTIERIIDIKQSDLINEKVIISSINFKFENWKYLYKSNYNCKEKSVFKCVIEANRVCKKDGIMMFAYLPNDSIMISWALLKGNLKSGRDDKQFDENFKMISESNEIMRTFYIDELEEIMKLNKIEKINNISTSGVAPHFKDIIDNLSDEEFEIWKNYHFSSCERKEVQGYSTHMLYIGKKINE